MLGGCRQAGAAGCRRRQERDSKQASSCSFRKRLFPWLRCPAVPLIRPLNLTCRWRLSWSSFHRSACLVYLLILPPPLPRQTFLFSLINSFFPSTTPTREEATYHFARDFCKYPQTAQLNNYALLKAKEPVFA